MVIIGHSIFGANAMEYFSIFIFDYFFCKYHIFIYTGFYESSTCHSKSKLATYIKELVLKNLMTPFYALGSTASRLQSHYKEVVYIYQYIPRSFGTHLVDLRRMKSLVYYGASKWFVTGTSGLVIQCPNHQDIFTRLCLLV